MLPPFGAGGIQPLTRTTGVIVGSMTRKKAALPRAKASSEIHIMHATGAMPYHTLALVQQLLGNGFKSWIVGNREVRAEQRVVHEG